MRQVLKQITAENRLVSKNLLFWFGIFVVCAYLIYVLRSVLLPFAAGIIIGYLLDPFVSKFEKHGMNRTVATILVLLLVIVFVVPALLLFFSLIQEEFAHFFDAAPQYISSFIKKIEPLLADLQSRFPELQPAKIKQLLSQNMSENMRILGNVAKSLISNGMALINLISLLLITPVVTFYMLRDWKHFIKKVDSLLPRKSKPSIRKIAKQIDCSMAGFIRGQLSVCFLLGTYYSLGLYIVGLDMGLMVGFLAGLISFIPYVGSITGFVISILIAFAQFDSWTGIAAVVAVFVSGQFLEGNFLTPKLVGDSVGLHPVWIMFALLAGGVLLGFLGMMIAIPVAAIVTVLLRHAIENYKKSELYLEN